MNATIAGAPQVRGKNEIDLGVDPPPDLAIEVDITRSSVDQLAICASLGILEVWRYDGSLVKIYVLQEDGRYENSEMSVVLPRFPLGQLARVLQDRGSRSATQIARGLRQWFRDNLPT